jgi:hypothetical protein
MSIIHCKKGTILFKAKVRDYADSIFIIVSDDALVRVCSIGSDAFNWFFADFRLINRILLNQSQMLIILGF